MKAMEYYYLKNGSQEGPHSIEQLKSFKISPETLVWHEGLSDWTAAKNVEDLKALFILPPPIPISSPPPGKKDVSETKTKSISPKWYVIGFAIFVLLAIGIPVLTSQNDKGESSDFDDIENVDIEDDDNIEDPVIPEPNPVPNPVKPPKQLTEDEMRQKLYYKELGSPKNYLISDGTYRVNLAGNTVIEGSVSNMASICGFMNVEMRAKFFTSTNYVVIDRSFVLTDHVPPGDSKPFKYKFDGWRSDIDHWTLEIVKAEGY